MGRLHQTIPVETSHDIICAPEEKLFLKLLYHTSNCSLRRGILTQLKNNQIADRSFQATKTQQCLRTSKRIFTRSFKTSFWIPVARLYELVPHSSNDNIDEAYEFAAEACYIDKSLGQLRVKVSNLVVNDVSVCVQISKFDALFCPEAVFDDLRFQFLQRVSSCCSDFISSISPDLHASVDLQEISDFLSDFNSVLLEGVSSCETPIPDFASRIWPLYRSCLTDPDGAYYLNYTELLLLAESARLNVAVFSIIDCNAKLIGDHLNSDVDPFHLVALSQQDSLRTKRARGHFERLLPEDLILNLQFRNDDGSIDLPLENESHTSCEREREAMLFEDIASVALKLSTTPAAATPSDVEAPCSKRMKKNDVVPLVCFSDCLTLPTGIDLARSLESNLAGTVVPPSHISPAIPAEMPDVSSSRSAQWLGMFDVRCASHGQELYVADIHMQMAEELSSHLRQRVTLLESPDAFDLCSNGVWLDRTACAFLNCRWICQNCSISDSQYRLESNHPWDIMLREHVVSAHRRELDSVFGRFPDVSASLAWDIYLEALAVQERKNWPCVGSSIDRRSFAVTASVYNDDRIRSLLCLACGCIKLDSGRHNSEVEFLPLAWFLSLPPGALRLNFSMKRYRDLFVRPGTPLASD